LSFADEGGRCSVCEPDGSVDAVMDKNINIIRALLLI
jgi:hypothetical protein